MTSIERLVRSSSWCMPAAEPAQLCCFASLPLSLCPFPYEQCRQATAVTEGEIGGQLQAGQRVLGLVDADEDIFNAIWIPQAIELVRRENPRSRLVDGYPFPSSAWLRLRCISFTA